MGSHIIVAFLLVIQLIIASDQRILLVGNLLCSGESIGGRVHLQSGSNFFTKTILKDVRVEPDGRFELSWSSRWFNWPVVEPRLLIYSGCRVNRCQRETKFPLSESNFTSRNEAVLLDLGDIEIRNFRWSRYCHDTTGRYSFSFNSIR